MASFGALYHEFRELRMVYDDDDRKSSLDDAERESIWQRISGLTHRSARVAAIEVRATVRVIADRYALALEFDADHLADGERVNLAIGFARRGDAASAHLAHRKRAGGRGEMRCFAALGHEPQRASQRVSTVRA